MNQRTTRILFAVTFAGLGAACGGADSGGLAGLPGPVAETNLATSPPPSPAADLALCQRSCAQLGACGVEVTSTCVGDCLQAPVFENCARNAGNTCTGLALCTFRQSSAAFCGGEFVATPHGPDSCSAAANCTGNCTLFNQPAACACACAAALAPAQALNLAANNACAIARCPACRIPGDGIACIACFDNQCAGVGARCAAN